MTEIVDQTFLTALPDDKHSKSFVLSEDADELEIDADSSNDFDYKSVTNDEPDEEKVTEGAQTQGIPAPAATIIPSLDNSGQQETISPETVPIPSTGDNLQTVYTRSVYDYAGVIYGKSDDPHQSKLDHDIQAILGSSDPPPGFGFLHPKVYYLTQTRPMPMEPLRVWRGYNGNVYFVPIKVQQLESDRGIRPTQPRQRTAARTAPAQARRPQRSLTQSSHTRRSRKSLTFKSSSSKERTNTPRTRSGDRGCAPTIASENDLTSNTRTTFSEEEDNTNLPSNPDEHKVMWRSVITCMPAPKPPISKRSQYALDDIRAIKQQHLMQDPIGSSRPVLPNIRLIPKTKFLYRGLAYKEAQKIPGIVNENDENSFNSLKRPLVDYGRAQAYVRHEVQVARTKQKPRAPPTSRAPDDEQMTRSQTVLDLRETRKRIVKGTTAAHHPALKRPGLAERSTLPSSEVLVPVRTISMLNYAPMSSSLVCASHGQTHKTVYVSPVVSQSFDIPSMETNLTVSVVPNPEPHPVSARSSTVVSHVEPHPPPAKLAPIEHRPTTGKSSNVEPRPPSSNVGLQINAGEMTLLTKYVKRPRSTAHQPATEELNVTQHE